MYSFMKSKAKRAGKENNKPTAGAFGNASKFQKSLQDTCQHKRVFVEKEKTYCYRCLKIIKK
jgi:hypothetical protein